MAQNTSLRTNPLPKKTAGLCAKITMLFLISIVMGLFYVLMSYKLITSENPKGRWKHQNHVEVRNSNDKETYLKSFKRQAPSSKLNLEKFCQEDKARITRVLEFDSDIATLDSIAKILAQIISYPIQTACQKMKRVGHGAWTSKCYDGHKYVCLDDVEPSNCLVYSFGIENEISFEESMAAMDCDVYGYDIKNTDAMKANNNTKLHFDVAQIGTGDESKQLMDLLRQNGHVNESITYFKADIEGAEILGLPIWISSGALNNVKQVSFEFHSVEMFTREYWNIIQDLYRIGFRIISYDPNFCTAMDENGFYQFFEIVFRKTDICTE